MKRSLTIFIVVVVFSLAFAAAASADSMWASSAGTPQTFQDSVNAPKAWIGKSTVDLLTTLGLPNYTIDTSNGKTLAYVRQMPINRNFEQNVEQDFVIGQNGQITAVHVSRS